MLNLLVNAVLYRAISWSICPGGSYSFNNHSYSATGTYVDTLFGAGANGCDSISALILSVLPSPASVTHASFCNLAGYTFNGVNYTHPGNYADTLMGAGANGCDSIANLQLAQNGDSVNASATYPTFCSGDTVQICATAGFSSYHWNSGDSSACIHITQAGSYFVTITDRTGCMGFSDTVLVAEITSPIVTIHQLGDTLYSSVASSYQWYYNNQALGGDTNRFIITTQPGNYTVNVIDTSGCNGVSTAYNFATSVSKVAVGHGINVFPNPSSSGIWNLEVEESLLGNTCEIFDADGRIIFKSVIGDVHTELLPNVAGGVYILQLRTAQATYQLKLIRLN